MTVRLKQNEIRPHEEKVSSLSTRATSTCGTGTRRFSAAHRAASYTSRSIPKEDCNTAGCGVSFLYTITRRLVACPLSVAGPS
jgi:hypothetical protein